MYEQLSFAVKHFLPLNLLNEGRLFAYLILSFFSGCSIRLTSEDKG